MDKVETTLKPIFTPTTFFELVMAMQTGAMVSINGVDGVIHSITKDGKWGRRYHVTFDTAPNESLVFCC